MVFVIVRIELQSAHALLQVVGTGDAPRLFPRRVQGGKKHAGKDCNDHNYDEEFYKSELTESVPEVWNGLTDCIHFHFCVPLF